MTRLGFLKPSFQCIELQLEGTAKPFFLKLNFNWGGCQEEYIGQTGSLLKERVSVYKQHIQYPQYPMLKVGQHIWTFRKREVTIFPFFQIKEDNKALREAYEDFFMKKFHAHNLMQYYVISTLETLHHILFYLFMKFLLIFKNLTY